MVLHSTGLFAVLLILATSASCGGLLDSTKTLPSTDWFVGGLGSPPTYDTVRGVWLGCIDPERYAENLYRQAAGTNAPDVALVGRLADGDIAFWPVHVSYLAAMIIKRDSIPREQRAATMRASCVQIVEGGIIDWAAHDHNPDPVRYIRIDVVRELLFDMARMTRLLEQFDDDHNAAPNGRDTDMAVVLCQLARYYPIVKNHITNQYSIGSKAALHCIAEKREEMIRYLDHLEQK